MSATQRTKLHDLETQRDLTPYWQHELELLRAAQATEYAAKTWEG